MSTYAILYPVFAMFLLTSFVLGRLAVLRVGAIGRCEVAMTYYTTYRDGEEPEHIRVVTRNFLNLFEMPLLFYVGAILVFVTGQTSPWLVACAWAYVAMRFAHTAVHVTSNRVPVRFRIYFVSNFALLAMWVTLFVQLVRAG